MDDYKFILKFWFEDIEPKMWFVKDENFDTRIITKFSKIFKKATNNELTSWEENPDSTLALIILFDQFTRNMFRNSPESFAYDNQALNIAKKAINKGFDLKVKNGRNFFYMPFMHSENLENQNQCIKFFKKMARENQEDEEKVAHYAILHKKIIEKFGRFPHRNKILGRTSTPEEIKFLKEPNSSF